MNPYIALNEAGDRALFVRKGIEYSIFLVDGRWFYTIEFEDGETDCNYEKDFADEVGAPSMQHARYLAQESIDSYLELCDDVNPSEFEDKLIGITSDIIDILVAKNHDYGDAWRKHGLAGVLIRISDKSLRMKNLENQETLVVDEKVEDTLKDIAGYAILGLLKVYEDRGADGY